MYGFFIFFLPQVVGQKKVYDMVYRLASITGVKFIIVRAFDLLGQKIDLLCFHRVIHGCDATLVELEGPIIALIVQA